MQVTYKSKKIPVREVERVVLFSDIRGSSRTTVEQSLHKIAEITEKFYAVCKKVMVGMEFLEFYADESLAINSDSNAMVRKSLILRAELTSILSKIGLDVGIGIHKDKILYLETNDLDMGVIKVGSSLNIAKRLEESSYGGDIIISETVYDELTDKLKKEFKVKQEIKLRGWGLPIQTRVSIR